MTVSTLSSLHYVVFRRSGSVYHKFSVFLSTAHLTVRNLSAVSIESFCEYSHSVSTVIL